MAESFIEDPETDEAKRPSPLTSLMVNLRKDTLLSGGSFLMRENDGCSARLTGHQIYIILPLTMIRFLSSGVKNGELHDLKTDKTSVTLSSWWLTLVRTRCSKFPTLLYPNCDGLHHLQRTPRTDTTYHCHCPSFHCRRG
jgi:hypothetical protein